MVRMLASSQFCLSLSEHSYASVHGQLHDYYEPVAKHKDSEEELVVEEDLEVKEEDDAPQALKQANELREIVKDENKFV